MKLIHTFKGKLPVNFRMDSANKAALNKYEQNRHDNQQNNYTSARLVCVNLTLLPIVFPISFHSQTRKTKLTRQCETTNFASRPAKIPVMLPVVGEDGMILTTLIPYLTTMHFTSSFKADHVLGNSRIHVT